MFLRVCQRVTACLWSVIRSNRCVVRFVAAPVGVYRVCWNYLDSGVLYIVGPTSSVDVSCISGLSCPILGLVGEGFAPEDKITVAPACGDAPVPGFPNKGS